MPAVEGISS